MQSRRKESFDDTLSNLGLKDKRYNNHRSPIIYRNLIVQIYLILMLAL